MDEKNLDVCVLGRIGYDLYAVEQNRPLAEVEHFARHLGGSSANMAVGLARLGLRTGIISCIGKDALADYLLRFLRQEGVDTQHVRLVEGYSTSLCLTEVSPPDRFPQVFYRQRPADIRVEVGETEKTYIRRARMFVTNGTSLSASPAREATQAALRVARESGARTVLDVDYRPSSWKSSEEAGEEARRVLPWVEVVLGNEEELEILSGQPDKRSQVEAVLSRGVKVLVRKLGAKGAQVFSRDRSLAVEPCRGPVMCAIGGGDGFASGFLWALYEGLDLADCLRHGNAAAAVVVSRVSCADAMPRRREFEQYLREQPVATLISFATLTGKEADVTRKTAS